ncbi:MAG: hypothetical protein KGL16_13615, partial [Acidobacteriota bacterium]|nr:hypothetical protein [Acidobacteriota bacterium]
RGNRPVYALWIAAAALAVTALLILQRSPGTPAITTEQPDLSAQWKVGPTLRDLRANFAVLRGPGTTADRTAVATFRYGVGVGAQMRRVSPEEVRLLGRVNDSRVYLIVDPLFRHRTTGRVVAHMMSLAIGDTGFAWGPENYLIFPTMVAQSGQLGPSSGPSAYVSVVPDGVRRVKWQFACPSGSAGAKCQLPPQRVVVLPVHDNLVSLQMNTPTSWSPSGNVARVTWYGADGLTKVFTDPNTAVPFPGAPAHRA